MNRSLLSLLHLLCALAFAFPLHAESREAKRIQQGKITKNEAQHLVLKKFPKAKILKCELKLNGNHSVWMVELVRAGDQQPSKLQVDGSSGKITP